MGYPLRIETKTGICLITRKVAGSRMYFANNPKLQKKIVEQFVRYCVIYKVEVFAFVILGNHYHLVARFPHMTRGAFLKDFNTWVSKAVKEDFKLRGHVTIWGGRPHIGLLGENEDVIHWSLYTALNSVSSGLTKDWREFPGFVLQSEAVGGEVLRRSAVNLTKYRELQKQGHDITRDECREIYEIKIQHLPGVDMKNYHARFWEMIENAQDEMVTNRQKSGYVFPSPEVLRSVKPGSMPKNIIEAKNYGRYSFILCKNTEKRKQLVLEYLEIKALYDDCSSRLRSGELDVEFPTGTTKPAVNPVFTWAKP